MKKIRVTKRQIGAYVRKLILESQTPNFVLRQATAQEKNLNSGISNLFMVSGQGATDLFNALKNPTGTVTFSNRLAPK